MHTQTALADWLVTSKQAHYLFIVKANQPTLYRQVQTALTGPDIAFAKRSARQTSRGHGRIETRTIRVATADGVDFPTPPRSSGCAATTPAWTAYVPARRSPTASPACPRIWLDQPRSTPSPAATGRSRTSCTTYETST